MKNINKNIFYYLILCFLSFSVYSKSTVTELKYIKALNNKKIGTTIVTITKNKNITNIDFKSRYTLTTLIFFKTKYEETFTGSYKEGKMTNWTFEQKKGKRSNLKLHGSGSENAVTVFRRFKKDSINVPDCTQYEIFFQRVSPKSKTMLNMHIGVIEPIRVKSKGRTDIILTKHNKMKLEYDKSDFLKKLYTKEDEGTYKLIRKVFKNVKE